MQPLEFEVKHGDGGEGLTLGVTGLDEVQDVRFILGALHDAGFELAEPIGHTLHDVRQTLGERATGLTQRGTGLSLEIGGTEFGPYSQTEAEELEALSHDNAMRINSLFFDHFGVDPKDRYMGHFPYPDSETGACKVSELLSVADRESRDRIVVALEAAIEGHGIEDVYISHNDETERETPWPYSFGINITGESIKSNIDGERRMKEVIDALESDLQALRTE